MRQVALAEWKHLGKAASSWLKRLDSMLPGETISTSECAENERYVINKNGDPVKFRHSLTPYVRGIEDACDMRGVQVVAVKGPARSGKTTAAENKCFKNWLYGPSQDVIWYMQTKDDVEEYCEERLEPMLAHHKRISEHVNWNDRRHRLTRKRIRGSLARFLAATPRTLRGKAAPIIIGDEIDGYVKKVRKAFLTMAKNRQREYGSGSLLYVCSHPDEGPKDGIDAIIEQSLQHLWTWNCVHCDKPSSPAAEANVRMNWNVAELLKDIEDMDRSDVLEMVEREACLICPHCNKPIHDPDRVRMSHRGKWLQPHQQLMDDGEIDGDARTARIMGFVIHAFMMEIVTVGEMARDYVAAKFQADDTQEETGLKEVVVKTLGETFQGNKAEHIIENWQIVKARLVSDYKMGTVPEGAQFLTAFVDPQVDRFEVRVIAWNKSNESWLVDAFALKQWAGFKDISPSERLADWDVIEKAVIEQSYPLASNRGTSANPHEDDMFLSIGKTLIDAHGQPGVNPLARAWMSNLTNPNRRMLDAHRRHPVEIWRVELTKGDAHKKGELLGRATAKEQDGRGKVLEHSVFERTLNVHGIKLIMAKRMKISSPGPGKMNFPRDCPDRYFKELVSEKLIGGDWIPSGRNETWDGFVSGEAAKELLKPHRPEIDWVNDPPIWAKPLPRRRKGEIKQVVAQTPESYYDRLLKANIGTGDDDYGDEL